MQMMNNPPVSGSVHGHCSDHWPRGQNSTLHNGNSRWRHVRFQ